MSYYTGYSNQGATPWSALVDVVSHPIDSLRAFVAAPIALLSGGGATVAEKVSGIQTPKLSDLPAQTTIAEIVRAEGDSLPTQPEQDSLVPTWLKFTIAGCAIIGTAVAVMKAVK